LGTGALLTLAHFAYVASVPRGAWEFGYAPFSPEPLPYAPMRGFTYEQLWDHVSRLVLLTPGLVLLAFGAYRLRPVSFRPSSRSVVRVGIALGVAWTAYVVLGVLRGRAIVDDELAYRMQARFFGQGQLANSDFNFMPGDVFTIHTRLGYTGKYLPGEGIVQIPGVLLGLPALLHVPLLLITLLVWHRAVALRAGPRFADFATTALALSPTVMLTSATGLSEATSLCCIAVAGLGLEWARGPRPLAGAIMAALAVGFGLATRPQSLVPAGAVLVPCIAWALWRRRAWTALAALGLVLALGLSAIGWYDARLSGSAFTLPWYLQCTIEHYGFGPVWKYDTFEHTPLTALENLGVVALRMNAWWLGFPCSLGVLALAVWLRRPGPEWRAWYAVALAIIAFEFAYYSPGMSDTGSLYHYELVLPGSLIAAGVADACLARMPGLTTTALAVHALFGTAAFTLEQTARLSRLVRVIHADSDEALARVRTPALFFYETRASETRPAGWIFDPFPERNRGQADAIVTFPLVPASFRVEVSRSYPGRHCYYYRRDPDSERAELRRCEDAAALMDRSPGVDDGRPLWIPPTAYKLTPYSPLQANALRHRHDAFGTRRFSCCALREFENFGIAFDQKFLAACVEDGPSWPFAHGEESDKR
jgi:hypothetical protein